MTRKRAAAESTSCSEALSDIQAWAPPPAQAGALERRWAGWSVDLFRRLAQDNPLRLLPASDMNDALPPDQSKGSGEDGIPGDASDLADVAEFGFADVLDKVDVYPVLSAGQWGVQRQRCSILYDIPLPVVLRKYDMQQVPFSPENFCFSPVNAEIVKLRNFGFLKSRTLKL